MEDESVRVPGPDFVRPVAEVLSAIVEAIVVVVAYHV